MNHWIRKNNKKILAIVGVFLMVSFVATLPGGYGGKGDMVVVGHIGKTDLLTGEMQAGENEWRLLSAQNERTGSLAQNLLFLSMSQMCDRRQAESAAVFLGQQVDAKTYTLLRKEAQLAGVQATDDEVNQLVSFVDNQLGGKDLDHERRQARNVAIAHFASVLDMFRNRASMVRISRPARVQAIAASMQTIAVNLTEFPADAYRPVAPTTSSTRPVKDWLNDLAREQFQSYRDTDPDRDAFGFGYRYPNRVQIEYVTILRDDVKKTVTEYDTYRHYLKHQEDFPTTSPASTQPASKPVASTGPTTRPYDQVRTEIEDQLTDRKVDEIAHEVLKGMQSEFSQLRAQGSSSAPSGDTLGKLAARIQARYKVLPSVTRVYEFKSEKDLATLRDPGRTTGIGNSTPQGLRATFPQYAVELAADFLSTDQKNNYRQRQLNPLALHQPSVICTDGGNAYLFRLIGTNPAHPPQTLDEVRPRVEADVLTKLAYEHAQADARGLLKVAQATGLQAAANAYKGLAATTQPAAGTSRPSAKPSLKVITTGLFGQMPMSLPDMPPLVPIDNYQVMGNDNPLFVKGAFSLLKTQLTTGQPHPTGLIDLPGRKVVLVAELDRVEPLREDVANGPVLLQAQSALMGERLTPVVVDCFTPANVVERLGYKEVVAPARKGNQRQPAQPAPNFNPFQ